jgi:hypothetical protein
MAEIKVTLAEAGIAALKIQGRHSTESRAESPQHSVDQSTKRVSIVIMKIREKFEECAVGEGVKASATAQFGSPFPIDVWDIKKVELTEGDEFVWVRKSEKR